jgi:hypothetical protein
VVEHFRILGADFCTLVCCDFDDLVLDEIPRFSWTLGNVLEVFGMVQGGVLVVSIWSA